MSTQSQTVIVTRLADRHADLHGRDFAESVEVVVSSDGLGAVLSSTAALVDLPIGRYSITVSEPWDCLTPPTEGCA
jgi:hypothetical protein